MDPLTGIVLPVALVVAAVLISRHESKVYREAQDFGSDVFVYSRRRYRRRTFGVLLMVVTAGTLVGVEWVLAAGPVTMTIYLAVLVTEVAVLLLLPLFDLWETARTARPGDLTRQGDPDRRTRTRPDRPR